MVKNKEIKEISIVKNKIKTVCYSISKASIRKAKVKRG